MSSHIGTVPIYVEAADPPTAELNPGNDSPFAVLELTPTDRARAYIALRTRADADALVKAALAARDLLSCGDIAKYTGMSCELAPGHDGWHRAGQITWPWADSPEYGTIEVEDPGARPAGCDGTCPDTPAHRALTGRGISSDPALGPANRIGEAAPLPDYQEPPGIVTDAGEEVTTALTTWTTIPAHTRSDGTACRFSGQQTNRADRLCPDRCQAPGAAGPVQS